MTSSVLIGEYVTSSVVLAIFWSLLQCCLRYMSCPHFNGVYDLLVTSLVLLRKYFTPSPVLGIYIPYSAVLGIFFTHFLSGALDILLLGS